MNTKNKLTELASRLKDCHPLNFDLCLVELLIFMNGNLEIKGILKKLEAIIGYSKSSFLNSRDKWIEDILENPQNIIIDDLKFFSHYEKISFNWHLLCRLTQSKKTDSINFMNNILISNNIQNATDLEKGRKLFVEPLVNYVYDNLSIFSEAYSLLIKYKKYREWFYREFFFSQFEGVSTKKKESFLDMDLRRFLFTNGIEYPFSKTETPIGIPDIIANLNSNDPIAIEVKYLNKNQGYRSQKIAEGFAQIIKYTESLNLPIGYLVVFNTDDDNVEIKLNGINSFPIYYDYNGKRLYIIMVNINPNGKTASKIKKVKYIELTEKELMEDVNTA